MNEKNENDILQNDFLFQKFEQNNNSGPKAKRSASVSYNKSNMFRQNEMGVTVNKGDEMGRFNMGSTVVVIFETEPNFKLNVEAGERVVYGQRVGVHQHENS